MNDPSDAETIASLKDELEVATGVSVRHGTDSTVEVEGKMKKIINSLFYSVIAITMFLCFFSLSASMSANLFEQKKEVAILRAIGVTRSRIKLLYFYEALVLVIASSTLGVMIGMLIGYTMVF